MAINPAHQLVILARLSEFCQFRGATLYFEKDPWEYMRHKLLDIEEPLTGLKAELFAATKTKLLAEMRSRRIDDERYADFRVLFDRLLNPGDFSDLAIHLSTAPPNPATQLQSVMRILGDIQPTNLFIEERRAPAERTPSWEKLIAEICRRTQLDRLGELLARKPRTRRRKSYYLRRVRKNVAEYCTVLRVPTNPGDTFTPFMLPRIEALVAANLRFLAKYR